jgi:hypothetical protein
MPVSGVAEAVVKQYLSLIYVIYPIGYCRLKCPSWTQDASVEKDLRCGTGAAVGRSFKGSPSPKDVSEGWIPT